MHLKNDKRKLVNLTIFTTIWALSGALFGYQIWTENKTAHDQWNRLMEMTTRQIKLGGSGINITYMQQEIIKTIHSFADLRSEEMDSIKTWVEQNVNPQLANLSVKEINTALSGLKQFVLPAI